MHGLTIEEKRIEDMIYEIRSKQVMLECDLSRLYECKNGTKEINQAVRNNLKKFPEGFSWVLTDNEFEDFLLSKILIANEQRSFTKKRFNPRVFTEQGVAMLATIQGSKMEPWN